MELTIVNGIYNRNEIETLLPATSVIKQALLNLDYSRGTIQNEIAANQLAKQFCLSEIQRNVARREDGAKLWLMRVNGSIQDLVRSGEMARTMRATIITPEALENMVINFFRKLGYESVEVEVDENQGGVCNASIDIRTRTIQTEGLKFSVDITPPDASTDTDDPNAV